MISDFGYINARIRAMRSYLLKKDDYEELLKDIDSFFLYLRGLPSYSRDTGKIFFQEATGDEVLKNSLTYNFRKIINFCGGRPKQLILFILHRWDIYNLKVILRGILNDFPSEEIWKSILCLGEWDENLLMRLSEQDSLNGIINILASDGSSWSRGIRSILQGSEKKPLKEIENALDIFYFKYCIDSLDENEFDDSCVLEFLKLEIDFRNILMVIDAIAKQSSLDKSYIIKGGRISEDFILNVSQTKNVEELFNILANSYYKDILSQAASLYRQRKNVVSLENFFKKQLLLWANKLYRQGALNIGIAIGYLQMEEVEIINLRTIAKGLYYGMEPDFLREELILV